MKATAGLLFMKRWKNSWLSRRASSDRLRSVRSHAIPVDDPSADFETNRAPILRYDFELVDSRRSALFLLSNHLTSQRQIFRRYNVADFHSTRLFTRVPRDALAGAIQ